MKKIDISTWNRREHFAFFRKVDLPFYNVNTQVDITGLPELAKSKSISINSLLIFLTIQSMNQIDNFRYRIRDDSVYLHDAVHPSFTHLKKGEELFRIITMDFDNDLKRFDDKLKQAVEESTSYFDLSKAAGRDDLVFISSLPWISFTGLDHTLSLDKDDAIPRVSWGRYVTNAEQTLLPFNIRVNHVVVDGLHVGLFFEEFARQIKSLRELA
ncbi:chloramphenicol acetyltransferase [Undibacterium amnicola]|uniref:Chloramphenicol acetyltransferase n=1 Tax=Undibacterium amnicola TaxID=1834038 RepID=A0ABR6XQU6_9BURK|nr:CatA-like O-acetyltransferase [Undibacterium amnicola]MBC3831867.1 chloramphenicol acetyltransferase [Undibacterium amnicola]